VYPHPCTKVPKRATSGRIALERVSNNKGRPLCVVLMQICGLLIKTKAATIRKNTKTRKYKKQKKTPFPLKHTQRSTHTFAHVQLQQERQQQRCQNT